MYTPIYDCTLLIFAVILFGVQTISKWLLGLLYLVPAVTVSVASITRIQLYTILLVILASIMMRQVKRLSHMKAVHSDAQGYGQPGHQGINKKV